MNFTTASAPLTPIPAAMVVPKYPAQTRPLPLAPVITKRPIGSGVHLSQTIWLVWGRRGVERGPCNRWDHIVAVSSNRHQDAVFGFYRARQCNELEFSNGF